MPTLVRSNSNLDLGDPGEAVQSYTTIVEAIANGASSIAIRDASDVSPIIIPAGAVVQKIFGVQGPDVSSIPVALTVNKNNVTIEQLNIIDVLEVASGADGSTLRDILCSGAGRLLFSGVTMAPSILDCRFDGATQTPITISAGVAGLHIARSRFTGTVTATNFIDNQLGPALLVDHCQFMTNPTGYAVKTANVMVMIGCPFASQPNGAIDITDGQDHRIIGCGISGNTGTTPLVRINAPAGGDSRVMLVGNELSGTGVLFEYVGADANADGILLVGNRFLGGTVKGYQNALWQGNYFSPSCTINFQSKTGMVVLGGDMTGCTLQNIAADTVFRNVMGQADRGTYTGGTWAADLLSDVTATRKIGALTNLWLDGWFGTVFAQFLYGVSPTPGSEVQRLTTVATNDDPIKSLYQNRVATVDATVTTLHTFTVPASKAMGIHVEVLARRTGGVLGTDEDCARYILEATYKNVAGVATLVGAILLPYTAESQVLWDCTLVPSGATVLLRVTGAVQNNITWHMPDGTTSEVGT